MTAELLQRKLIITPIGGGSAINLSDYVVANYTDIIIGWGDIQSSEIDPITWKTSPATCSFTVQNNITVGGQARFTSIPGLMFASVVVQQNGVTVFAGNIDEITNISNVECTVNCVGSDAALSKKFAKTIINTADFPSADVADIGKMIPVVYGAAKRVPLVGVDVGLSGKLLYGISGVAPGGE